jgi:hypothetical protein
MTVLTDAQQRAAAKSLPLTGRVKVMKRVIASPFGCRCFVRFTV